jgi:imidazolonepropionase-like amidohydrolase
MKYKIAGFIAASCCSLASFCQTYISNVTVIDVEKQKLLPGQTVVITNDIITGIQPSKKIKIPATAMQVDGTGKFLLPGMTDAHVHFFQSGGLYARPDAIDLRKQVPYKTETDWSHNNMEDLLRRYIQTGITSVFDVGATNNFLQQRDSFASKYYAPDIFMTGPLLTSYEPAVFENLKNDEPFSLTKTVEDAKKYVQQQLPFHPDFIKIWYIVMPGNTAKNYLPVVKAIIDEAHANNLKVAVHATERITAQLAVENGCDFLVHDVEDEVIPDEFIQLLKAKKTVVCPTLVVAGGYSNTFAQKNNFTFYDLTRSNPQQIGSLFDLKHLADTVKINSIKKQYNSKTMAAYIDHEDSVRAVNVKKMADAGVILAAGTDAGNIGTQHASSFLGELKAMQKAGMSSWQVLQSATINASKILSRTNNFGSIAVGKKANLVLLNANPVESLDNLAQINLVINKGYVIKPDTLIKETALALVQRQLNAYNARNIEAFLEPYADDVELYQFPGQLIAKGKEAMRKDYVQMFTSVTNLHCEIKERIVQGNIIIDKESVSGFGKNKLEATAIYEITGNKIKKVYFIQ